ncbi:MAG: TonB-dependent receptor [Flavobacteriales bacterium]|nr:TonB-dependent receptor [Flavobacteriales bacterium]
MRYALTFNSKLNAKNQFKSGIIIKQSQFENYVEYYNESKQRTEIEMDSKDSEQLYQGFVSWKHRFNKDLTMVGGLHSMYYSLNQEVSVEPRLALKWRLTDKQSVNAGFGMHSKNESLLNYSVTDSLGVLVNLDLKLIRANHYVLGYDYRISERVNLKVEIYYQGLRNVPVIDDVTNSYSSIDELDWFSDVDLVSKGTAQNYGLEVTLERFLDNEFYFLANASLFESKYAALDGVSRNTAYNSNYTANFLIGKTMKIGKAAKNRTLSIDSKFFLSGPRGYTAIDPVTLERMNDQRNETKGDPIFQMNLALSLKRNKGKTTRELQLDILNVTNNKAKLNEYVTQANEIVAHEQLSLIPNLTYRVYF